ncbi:MAG: hypothetical protein WC714_14080 [Candidatus Obscuribacterales bacterium]
MKVEKKKKKRKRKNCPLRLSQTVRYFAKNLTVWEMRKSDGPCVSLTSGVIVTTMNQTQSNLAKALPGQSISSVLSVQSVLSAPSAKSLRRALMIALVMLSCCKPLQALPESAKSHSINQNTDHSTTEKTDAECWQIAAENFSSFGDLSTGRIEKLFGNSRATKTDFVEWRGPSHQTVTLDKNTSLEISWTSMFFNYFIDEIVLAPSNQDASEMQSRLDKEFGECDWENDSKYTNATCRDEDAYWKTLTTNLQGLLGLKKQQLIQLLGPERCSSKKMQTLDYKIGLQRLRFYFKNERVAFLQLATRMYDWPNGFGSRYLKCPVRAKLWPVFEAKIDKLIGARIEDYKISVSSCEQQKLPMPGRYEQIISAFKLRKDRPDYWFLDDRIAAIVSMDSGLIKRITFEPIQKFEDRQVPHGHAKKGWDEAQPSVSDDVYTGAIRRDEATYWAAIKPNLRNIIGMKRQEIIALLGPERCSFDAGKSMDYRIGNNRLRLFLENKVVIGFELTNDMYLHDT